ncbi:MAG: purine-nucleoside phosphorylase [Deltaproteobacteria bacterium]|nr:purine-nucleoside phosphorylase [Deltaproteobacteria bacterium]MBW2145186.1 purine-nucleoside phosphorylase [Deltaproteobacteria bacterium]
MLEKIKETSDFLKSKMAGIPEVGMITGTGLDSLTDQMTVSFRLPYKDIPNFPISTIEGHSGTMVVGELAGKEIIAMEGRFHIYEGYSPAEITFPVRVLAMLGTKYLLISSAVGGLNPQFEKGDLMVVTDHINLTGTNPLIGPNLDDFGPRFPDMSAVYDAGLITLARQEALESRISLRQGIYVGLVGPSLETPAETRFLRITGADAVGMSTVSEAIVAAHCGLKIIAIVVITNMNLPDCMQETSIEEVIATARESGKALSVLWKKIIPGLPS